MIRDPNKSTAQELEECELAITRRQQRFLPWWHSDFSALRKRAADLRADFAREGW